MSGVVIACAVSCASSPDATPRELDFEPPDAWAAASTSADASTQPVQRWWDTFGVTGLTAAVDEALAENDDLAAAAARLGAAAARVRIAGADSWPQLTARADHLRQRQNFIGLPIPGTSGVLSQTFQSRALSLDVSWELDVWGRIEAGETAAESNFEAALDDYRGARLSLAAQTAKTWFAVVEARLQLELAEATAATYRRSAARIESRFQRGVRPALDLRLARTDQAAADALVALRRSQLEELTRALEILRGRYPRGEDVPPDELPTPPARVAAGLPADLIARRPDVAAAERRLAAADARLAQAQASLYPRLSLTASGGTSSEDLEDLVDLDFRVWSFAGNLFVPLFEGGRLRANVDLNDAEREAALFEFASAALQAYGEIESALAVEDDLADREAFLTSSLDEARAALRQSEDRYDLGLIDVITLLGTQRRALDAETQLLLVRRQRLDRRIDLLLALGGGIDPDEESTADDGDESEDDTP